MVALVIHMGSFGDIKDVPDSCDGEVGFFIAGSSCPICPHSKTVSNLSVACSSAELKLIYLSILFIF